MIEIARPVDKVPIDQGEISCESDYLIEQFLVTEGLRFGLMVSLKFFCWKDKLSLYFNKIVEYVVRSAAYTAMVLSSS